jgi:hypothetical protein
MNTFNIMENSYKVMEVLPWLREVKMRISEMLLCEGTSHKTQMVASSLSPSLGVACCGLSSDAFWKGFKKEY